MKRTYIKPRAKNIMLNPEHAMAQLLSASINREDSVEGENAMTNKKTASESIWE